MLLNCPFVKEEFYKKISILFERKSLFLIAEELYHLIKQCGRCSYNDRKGVRGGEIEI
jgi:hypothetical protein